MSSAECYRAGGRLEELKRASKGGRNGEWWASFVVCFLLVTVSTEDLYGFEKRTPQRPRGSSQPLTKLTFHCSNWDLTGRGRVVQQLWLFFLWSSSMAPGLRASSVSTDFGLAQNTVKMCKGHQNKGLALNSILTCLGMHVLHSAVFPFTSKMISNWRSSSRSVVFKMPRSWKTKKKLANYSRLREHKKDDSRT